jgi:hypothetical protein
MPGDSSTEMSCSLRPLACSGVVKDCAEAELTRAIFKTLKVMNVGNMRARVFESDKSVFMIVRVVAISNFDLCQ